MTIRVHIPDEFIGKWCITRVEGTHGSYDSIVRDNFFGDYLVFDTQQEAEIHFNNRPYSRTFCQTMKISKDYPILEIQINLHQPRN